MCSMQPYPSGRPLPAHARSQTCPSTCAHKDHHHLFQHLFLLTQPLTRPPPAVRAHTQVPSLKPTQLPGHTHPSRIGSPCLPALSSPGQDQHREGRVALAPVTQKQHFWGFFPLSLCAPLSSLGRGAEREVGGQGRAAPSRALPWPPPTPAGRDLQERAPGDRACPCWPLAPRPDGGQTAGPPALKRLLLQALWPLIACVCVCVCVVCLVCLSAKSGEVGGKAGSEHQNFPEQQDRRLALCGEPDPLDAPSRDSSLLLRHPHPRVKGPASGSTSLLPW